MPRWLLFVPLGLSFVALMSELWGLGWFREGWDRLTWMAALFPHALAFPISATALGASGATVAIVGLDAAAVALVLRTQPPRLDLRRLALLGVFWAALSVVTTLLAPYLIGMALRA